ncbi:MAG: ATP-binding protein [Gammaproteobacteria bacterium]|jgi:nitrogen fixation/metabolism regulation signal transduction histidine kinase
MAPALRRFASLIPMVGLFGLLLVSLAVMSEATQYADRFSRLYVGLFLFNLLILVFLTVLISVRVFDIVRQVLTRAPGARLTLRIILMFILLSLIPVSVVYYFSARFLDRSVDSWFNVQVETALEDALTLSRTALNQRKREYLAQLQEISKDLSGAQPGMDALILDQSLNGSSASQMTLFDSNNRILASSTRGSGLDVPEFPSESSLFQVAHGQGYVGIEPGKGNALQVRVLVPVTATDPSRQGYLQAVFPIEAEVSNLASNVQSAYSRYKELQFQRTQLKETFTITLALVLMLSVLFAVWLAFGLARRLIAPVQALALATRAVASGDLHKRLPVEHRDELGFLTRSFNEMTTRLSSTHEELERSRSQAEVQRTYLQAVLQHLSSGVITLDRKEVLRTCNAAASNILGLPLEHHIGRRLADIARKPGSLESFYEGLLPQLQGESPEWEAQMTLQQPEHRVLMCRGARLPEDSGAPGSQVIVFDDITDLIRAQREAAWGEVARRMAHEIRNPLTPIQLSAERLERKLAKNLGPQQAELLVRATRTIIQQVEALQNMVNAFSEYARMPTLRLEPLSLNQLINEVGELYRANKYKIRIDLDLSEPLPEIRGDRNRLRQVLHNLIRNALEALENRPGGVIRIATRCDEVEDARRVRLVVEDNGPGLSREVIGQLFDPYITNKTHGTGLGLAVVKKIIEEHGGSAWAENRTHGGARFILLIPVMPAIPRSSDEVQESTA